MCQATEFCFKEYPYHKAETRYLNAFNAFAPATCTFFLRLFSDSTRSCPSVNGTPTARDKGLDVASKIADTNCSCVRIVRKGKMLVESSIRDIVPNISGAS